MIKRVLITDDCHPFLTEGLIKMGYVCDFDPDITPEATLQKIDQYEGLIINSKINVNQVFLDKALKLKFVGRLGSGMEIVDKVYAAKKGVAIISSPEGNRNAVAEQALGMLLMLANNLNTADRELRQYIWKREDNRGWELEGKTIGIIGFGHTGSQFAKKLSGMGMTVLAYDKYKDKGYAADFFGVEETTFQEIQRKADIISLHLPLTSETKHIVDTVFIDSCKPGFVLINTSRGHCVKTLDLIEALERGQIKGACLDVFENEKPKTYTNEERLLYERLYHIEQVVLAPHIAGWTHESKRKMAEILLEKIMNLNENT